MDASEVEKGAMVLDGSKLTIFGDWGSPNGKTWIIPFFGGGGVSVEVDAKPISPNIVAVINSDIQNGNADKIVCLQVNPRTAVLLYLEGKITRKDIEKAVADDSSVMFEGISFSTENGEMSLPVVVRADAQYTMATMDKNGDIV